MEIDIRQRIVEFAESNDLRDFSLREIGQEIHPKGEKINPQNIKYHWTKLFNEGLIDYLPGSSKSTPFIHIPIRGYADCGKPRSIAVDEDLGSITLTKNFLQTTRTSGLFGVIASGNSMNKAKIKGGPINDGDYVIVDSTATAPSSGDYVVTIVDNLANIKRFYREKDRVVLVSESTEAHNPIVLYAEDEALIAGTVKQVVRKVKTA